MSETRYCDRPARASATLSTAVALVGGLVLAVALGLPGLFVLVAVGTILLAAGTVLLDAETLPRIAGGSVAVVLGSILTVGGVVLPTVAVFPWFFLLPITLATSAALGFAGIAAFAVFLGGTGRFDSRHLRRLTTGLLGACLAAAIGAVGLAGGTAAVTLPVRVVTALASALSWFASLHVVTLVGTVLLLGALTATAVRAALRRTPVAAVATYAGDDPTTARRRIDSLVDRLGTAAIWLALGGLLWLFVGLPSAAVLWVAVDGSLPAVTVPSLPFSLVVFVVCVLTAYVVVVAVSRRLVRAGPRTVSRPLARFAGGIVATPLAAGLAALAPHTSIPDALSDAVLVLVGVSVLTVVAVAVAATLFVCVAVRVVPRNGGGPAMTTACLLLATVSAGIAHAGFFELAVATAAALVVWDLGSYAESVGREVGRAGTTTVSQGVHAGVSLAVGAGAIVVATGGSIVGSFVLGIVSPSLALLAAILFLLAGLALATVLLWA